MQKEWQVIYQHIAKLNNPGVATTDIFSIFLSILFVAFGIFFLTLLFYLAQRIYHKISRTQKALVILITTVLAGSLLYGFSYVSYWFWQHRKNDQSIKPIVIHGSFDSLKKFQAIQRAEKQETTLETDFEIYLKNTTLYSLIPSGKLIEQRKLDSFSFTIQSKTFAQHLQKHLTQDEKIYFLFTAKESFIGYIQGKRVFLVK